MWSTEKSSVLISELEKGPVKTMSKPREYVSNHGSIVPVQTTSSEKMYKKSDIIGVKDASTQFRKVVLDAGAFITRTNLTNLGIDTEYYTIEEVVSELRDEQARHLFNTFPFPINIVEVKPEALLFISEFAKKTGDYYVLSQTDLKVLALTYMLEIETHGTVNIYNEPKYNVIGGRPPVQEEDMIQEDFFNDYIFADAVEVNPFDIDTFINGSEEEYLQTLTYYQKTIAVGENEENSDYGFNTNFDVNLSSKPMSEGVRLTKINEDKLNISTIPGFNDGQWITKDNIADIKILTTNPDAKKPKDLTKSKKEEVEGTQIKSTVGCITTDFAMQSVLLQSGLRVIATDTRFMISSLKQWLNRCHACYTVTRDMSRIFCPACGGQTLIRVSTYIDSHGNVNYRWNPYKISKEEKPLELPPELRTGKQSKVKLLREDINPVLFDRMNKLSRSKAKISSDALYEAGAQFAGEKSRPRYLSFGSKR